MMTVTLELPPEREAALKAAALAQGVSTQQWLQRVGEERLQNGDPPDQEAPAGKDDRPIWEIFVDAMKDVPPEAFDSLPSDGASQIDHYIYGHPKR